MKRCAVEFSSPEVPVGDARSTDEKLARNPLRHRCKVVTYDEELNAGNRPTDGHP